MRRVNQQSLTQSRDAQASEPEGSNATFENERGKKEEGERAHGGIQKEMWAEAVHTHAYLYTYTQTKDTSAGARVHVSTKKGVWMGLYADICRAWKSNIIPTSR